MTVFEFLSGFFNLILSLLDVNVPIPDVDFTFLDVFILIITTTVSAFFIKLFFTEGKS